MMEELGLDVEGLVGEMAIGLAVLHWEAEVDGMDVEFVLGGGASNHDGVNEYRDSAVPTDIMESTDPTESVETANPIDTRPRDVHLWVLDFDKASPIELITIDITTKLVPAFLGNNPYYPRPDIDRRLWDDFCKIYLEASEIILRDKKTSIESRARDLPQAFLSEVARVVEEHEGWNEVDNIVFAES